MRFRTSQIKPALTLASAVLVACNDAAAGPGEPGPVATVSITPLVPYVPVDTTLALSVTAKDSAGRLIPEVHVTWTSRDSTIASIDAAGVLRGHNFGAVSITATAEGKSATVVASVVLRWSAISAGGTYTCGITVTGVGYCWGNNVMGQLGINAADFDAHPVPAKVSGGLRLARIATGGGNAAHTCALTPAGGAFCWGTNAHGELGTHDTARALVPRAVAGLTVLSEISVGDAHTCALTQGHGVCWGDNSAGQLGAATGSDALAVKTVSGGLVFTSIAAGSDFTCAVTSGFAAYCWGGNTQGQLGTGSAGSGASAPTRAASGLLLASVVAGRGAVACGVVRPDAASCWGVNSSGQLGRGFISALEPAPDALSGDPSLVTVTAGLLHACGLSPDGAASCWGGAGFLGTTAGTASTKPVSVVHDAAFVFITAGTNHTCALTADGTAFCWGRNDLGQLGTGTASAIELTPVKVADHP